MTNKPLYDYIYGALKNKELPRDFSLPKLVASDEIVFADGALDGIYIYHMPKQEMNEKDTKIMAEAINAASNHEFDKADELFISLSKNNRAISISDKMQEYIMDNEEKLKAGNLYEYAAGLITISDNIECIKYALTILELLYTNNDELKDVIRVLSLSDEFTLFCVRLMNRWPDGNNDIFETAKKVHGWGRIHAVELLRPLLPRYDEIRNWMLKEGINNDVMPSYSALTCWKNANIGSILFVDPTYEEFVYIGKIIEAMLDEEAVAGLSTLDKRKEILLKYLEKAQNFTPAPEDYEIIYHIYQYANQANFPEVVKLAKNMLFTNNAKRKIIDAVKEGKAIDLAIEMGIDVKTHLIRLFKENFKNYSYLCRYLVNDKRYRKKVLNIYKNNLPLDKMKVKPSTTLGLGEKYDDQRALEFLLQELRNYPLEGTEFVEVGLQSAPTRTRNGALSVLSFWVEKKQKPLSEISPHLQGLLSKLCEIEPDEQVKERMQKLIAGDITFEEEILTLKAEDEQTISMETLNILSDAISDIGSWQWWYIDKEVVQLEFSDVQLYDDTKPEKAPHSSTIALQFFNNSFAMFLDNLEEETEKTWYEKLHDDEINPFEIECFEFQFNNAEYVNETFDSYKNKISMKDLPNEDIVSTKYILAAKCNDVGFVVGGDNLEILSHTKTYSQEEIKNSHERWWKYWEDYWRKRKTKEAYEKDFACEVTIPVNTSKLSEQ